MNVVVYTQPGDENSKRIKELLSGIGVDFEEHVCADGKVDGKELRSLDIAVSQVPLTVVDGVAIPGMNRARIEQAVGWVGF
jgi:glutaredoxin